MEHQSTEIHKPLIHRAVQKCGAVCYDCRVMDRMLPTAFLSGIALGLIYLFLFWPPGSFPAPSIVRIPAGATLGEVAADLHARGMIRFPALFELVARATGGNRRIHEGSYFFSQPQDAIRIALRLQEGDYELDPARVFVVEGATLYDVATLLSVKLAPFDTAGFLEAASSSEGFLYPDTYFFFPGQEPRIVARAMLENFDRHIAPIQDKIDKFGKPLGDVIIMASLLEREASKKSDREMIAGVLWRRLDIGMPLQVDATFGYVLDKNLTKLTTVDLRTDSPYNTYLNKGLPPTPIGNPGIAAIEAAVTPTKSNYLFYLSDRRGVTHYSATYTQHLRKKSIYLGS